MAGAAGGKRGQEASLPPVASLHTKIALDSREIR